MDIKDRNSLEITDTWDLNLIYKSATDWDIDLEQLKNEIPELGKKRGKIATNAEALSETLRLFLSLMRKAEKIYSYAQMTCDQDLSNQESLRRKEMALSAYSQLNQAASFLRPEILEIDQKQIELFLTNPILKDLRITIEEIVRYRLHTLSPKEESLLALGAEYFSSTSSIFSQLNNTELKFEPVANVGPLSHGTYSVMLRNPDRNIRAQAYKNYYKEFDEHKNTLSAIYSSSVKKNVFLAKAKNFSSALEQSIFSDSVSKKVYLTLIESVSDNLNNLHKYYDLRAKKLEIKQIFLYDTYTSLVGNSDHSFDYDKAASTIIEAVKPLGEEYQNILQAGLMKNRWVDKYENKGKRSGAYCGGCYDSSPYILINYQSKGLDSMFTLAHEAGHAMHSFLSNRNQTYQDHQYTIFVAEVASTVNELLLLNYLQNSTKFDSPMQQVLSNHLLDDIKSTLYRQTMFAEFELKVHTQAEERKPIGLEFYRKIYRDLLEKYFGKSVSIQETDELEFLRIPHFYSAFYVYKYATGLSAAIDISQRIISGDKKSTQDYLEFLASGGSKQPLDLLRGTGVDLEKRDCLDFTSSLFSKELARFKALIS